MGLRMKKINIFFLGGGVYWKTQFLGGVPEKPMYRGELSKKGGDLEISRFKEGGLAKKKGLVFFRRGWYLNAHYEL